MGSRTTRPRTTGLRTTGLRTTGLRDYGLGASETRGRKTEDGGRKDRSDDGGGRQTAATGNFRTGRLMANERGGDTCGAARSELLKRAGAVAGGGEAKLKIKKVKGKRGDGGRTAETPTTRPRTTRPRITRLRTRGRKRAGDEWQIGDHGRRDLSASSRRRLQANAPGREAGAPLNGRCEMADGK